jgi:hypothetical protein
MVELFNDCSVFRSNEQLNVKKTFFTTNDIMMRILTLIP